MSTRLADMVFEQVRQAYSDAYCLHFLSSEFVDLKTAGEAVEFIGPYNRFDPETTREKFDEIAEVDPDALVAIGREGSPVLYIDTDEPEAVLEIFDGYADELWEVDSENVGPSSYLEDGLHSWCDHSQPPVPEGAEASVSEGDSVVRAWFD